MITSVDREWAKKLSSLITEDPTLAKIEISAVLDSGTSMGSISSTDMRTVAEQANTLNISLADLGNLRAVGAVTARAIGQNRFEVTLHKKALAQIAVG